MLYLIGTGFDEFDISIKAIDILRNSDLIYYEAYTMHIEFNKLEKIVNKHFVKLERSDLENRLKDTIKIAKDKNVAILTPGDPLIATTHIIILEEAKKQSIETKVIHAPSIISVAIGESRLNPYRFGAISTIPKWNDTYKPRSFIEKIYKNLDMNLHSLVLLDVDNGKTIELNNAIKILKEADNRNKINKILILGDLGLDTQKIVYTSIESNLDEFRDKMCSIIVPAKLEFFEEERIKEFIK